MWLRATNCWDDLTRKYDTTENLILKVWITNLPNSFLSPCRSIRSFIVFFSLCFWVTFLGTRSPLFQSNEGRSICDWNRSFPRDSDGRILAQQRHNMKTRESMRACVDLREMESSHDQTHLGPVVWARAMRWSAGPEPVKTPQMNRLHSEWSFGFFSDI